MKTLTLQEQKQVRGGFFWFIALGLALIGVRAVGSAVATAYVRI